VQSSHDSTSSTTCTYQTCHLDRTSPLSHGGPTSWSNEKVRSRHAGLDALTVVCERTRATHRGGAWQDDLPWHDRPERKRHRSSCQAAVTGAMRRCGLIAASVESTWRAPVEIESVMRVCACVRACARARARVFVCVCMCVHVRLSLSLSCSCLFQVERAASASNHKRANSASNQRTYSSMLERTIAAPAILTNIGHTSRQCLLIALATPPPRSASEAWPISTGRSSPPAPSSGPSASR